jgi:shikimate kinase
MRGIFETTPVNEQADTPMVVFIGLRGSGKTTVGAELARLLGGECVDTDDLIARRTNQTIERIFREHGELHFRELEREAVATAIAMKPAVISLGGGAVVDPKNAALLQRESVMVVWLTAPIDVLWRRICDDPSTSANRPSLTEYDGPLELEALLAKRCDTYARLAHLVLDTEALTAREAANWIMEHLREC